MKKVGEPFKMKPLTRKAENALWRAAGAAGAVGVSAEDIRWGLWDDRARSDGSILVVAKGDRHLVSMRWVLTHSDPDWQIV